MTSQFNFFQHWYPLSPIEDLDPNLPTAVTLLGVPLVIWKPKSSETYRVFLDRCPHRLAPLSEGRVDEKTGNLMCSYHGWEFDAEGICTRIPQAENPELVIEKQKYLCATALPTRQEQDLLWVWPDVNSTALASTVPLPLSPQVDTSKGFVWSSFVRDLEYDWQTLVENVADPSHVAFAHHGIQGNREKATPIPIKIEESNPDLIKATTPLGSITFEPPCRLEYAIKFGETKQVGLVTYCIPISPGKSRIVGQFPRNFAKRVLQLTPRWWDHINNRNAVLDGDMILLQQQEYFLQQKQQKENWQTAYKLPTSADRLVIEFRKWFDKYSQGKLPWEEVGIAVKEKQEISDNRQFVLDRYRQHTQHCDSCRTAVLKIKRIKIALLGYVAITVPVVAVFPDAVRLKFGLPLIVVALLSLGVYCWLKFWLEPKFYFVDYVHAKR
ncbi:Rieske 2Fe-2S domain-containing protein [Argonema antarcticum]|uniref:aromatic ring-hydroxylating dioxygenase subunit alpha n=1 Tax=Argonema antarcticum TaxID=2942763 RepID=UPI0020118C8B|nr:Rieske 2Fe-2S domain-containing protein [Argonema antarcticum]MCL1473001.1 Rieske 2Fe-2S domain-containing protein [Argonema antarcticum A004/B2]